MIISEHFMFLMQKQKIVVMELFCYQNLYNPFFTMPGPENNDESQFAYQKQLEVRTLHVLQYE